MIKAYIVDNSSIDMRIDRWIKNKIGNLPQSLIEKGLRKGKIKLNDKKIKSSTKLKKNDEVKLYNFSYTLPSKQNKIKFTPSKSLLKENENQVIDNNDNFIVINKQAGISVQGGTKSKKNLIDIFSKSNLFDKTKPYTVHRLDKETSGILILAKNRETAKLLTSLFRLRRIHKTYLAITHGEANKQKEELINDLIRYEGKKKIIEKAVTHYKLLDKNSNCSFLELKPITGRKHQLRKQLLTINLPIVGDTKYFNNKNKFLYKNNLMLHSYKIKFMINNKKYNYEAILPNYFKKMLQVKKLKF